MWNPIDWKRTDNVQKYMILQNAKELLKLLNEEYEDFPYDSYFSGSEALSKAMAYVDDKMIHHGI